MSDVISTSTGSVVGSGVDLAHFTMDQQSTEFICGLLKTVGKNFVPMQRTSFDFDFVEQGVPNETCVEVKRVALRKRAEGQKGSDVILELTSTVSYLRDSESTHIASDFNVITLGHFSRYGIPEVCALNRLKAELEDTGFYISRKE